MKFSIIIPCYNERENIDKLISRITPLQSQYDLEYVLVENGSQDGSRDYFRQNIEGCFPHVEIVYVDTNQGYEYIGWLHADLQIPPEELIQFFDDVDKCDSQKIFLKGHRTNRSSFERFFTNGQSVFSTCLFRMKLYDIGAVPVLFHRSLLDRFNINDMPNDFSLDIYIYREAVKAGYDIRRPKVKVLNRENGNSSWNHGFQSRIRQSRRIIIDSFKIKRGEKVL